LTDARGNLKLVEVIKASIQKHPLQAIPFRDYMDLCLYHEPLGYYRNERSKIGREGDFYTSSSVGSSMGEMIAAYIRKESLAYYSSMETIHIVEWGGGNGRLAQHLLDELKNEELVLYERITYIMIESSGYHRELQREALHAHSHKIRHLTESDWLLRGCRDGVFVLANELLDAFPVHRVRRSGDILQECYVAWQKDTDIFQETWFPLEPDSRLFAHLEERGLALREGQIAEINLDASDWIRAIAESLDVGRMIIIDYGEQAEELYAAHRMQGTLLCYRHHQAYDNPFIYTGEQDITAHVDFTACIRDAAAAGFSGATLQTQREFLVEQGILHKLQNHFDPNPFSETAKKNRAIRQLLLSDQMSELFKVLILLKKGDPVV
jgi:SAM-dependent MidA family methyltransferase